MDLRQLEVAVKMQCVWEKNTNRHLQTNAAFEMKAELGQILFFGIAEMYGYSHQQIRDYIDVDSKVFYKRLKDFRRHHKVMMERIAMEEPSKSDFANKVYIKTAMIQNYIKRFYNNEEYLSYADIIKPQE